MSDYPPPVPSWRHYLPNPKVVAAAVTVLLIALLVWVLDVLGVDAIDAERVWSFVIGGGVAATAAYIKSD